MGGNAVCVQSTLKTPQRCSVKRQKSYYKSVSPTYTDFLQKKAI